MFDTINACYKYDRDRALIEIAKQRPKSRSVLLTLKKLLTLKILLGQQSPRDPDEKYRWKELHQSNDKISRSRTEFSTEKKVEDRSTIDITPVLNGRAGQNNLEKILIILRKILRILVPYVGRYSALKEVV